MDKPAGFCDTSPSDRGETAVLALRLIGALLIICGVVQLARTAINRGRLSDPGADPGDGTLEPRHRGVGFLGFAANWPGLAMMAAGALILLVPAIF
jgi:hypothetical protein